MYPSVNLKWKVHVHGNKTTSSSTYNAKLLDACHLQECASSTYSVVHYNPHRSCVVVLTLLYHARTCNKLDEYSLVQGAA